jgi:4'-phosphopantetheinyl transferase EntD
VRLIILRAGAIDGWLALSMRESNGPLPYGRGRRTADQRAARLARARAIAACGPGHRPLAVSIAHTEGSAAALAGTAEARFGVDLVRLSRVTPRHGRAIGSPRDRAALGETPPQCRDALTWALKEATAKATGAAQSYFPTGVRLFVAADTGSICTQVDDSGGTTFTSSWFVIGEMLCAIVASTTPAFASTERYELRGGIESRAMRARIRY